MAHNLTGKRILLLGDTGKMGQALGAALPPGCEIIRHNSGTFDAADLCGVRDLIAGCRPDLLINTVAFLGIDPCEQEPEKALLLNTLYPRTLAECSAECGFTLVHFSTDAVFSDRTEGACGESDVPLPINLYGFTKYGGDRFIREIAPQSYLIRVPILFGPSGKRPQFVEKMLGRIRSGDKRLRIADDIVVTPGYAPDIAAEVVRLLLNGDGGGLYHLANSGETSLHGLMSRITDSLGLDVTLEKGSHRDFPGIGRKNLRTPLISERIPALRPWHEAVADYCRLVAEEWRNR